ncbi:hypothetical protein KCV87_14620 [Actinosynnema pretiosum subsp. pretiosum]|uniref:Uncharacterized protein n=1 Tax=Actinosynnema pretiosum subsp. pretiosum TaxID=103721 RepID=A0AA45R6S6_9PSEU|nr:hypothetical protein KCV87_14620 [Actinosynnema pretiosum subsp. pretiosum]
MTTYRAAWVPDDDSGLTFDELEAPAVEWIEQMSAEAGVAPILVVNAVQSAAGPGIVAEFGRRYGYTTPRTKDHPASGVPVLAFRPTLEAFDYAQQLARGSALCVIEGMSFPLAMWAAEVGAINLLNPDAPVPVLDPKLEEDLDSIHFFGGNNGWSGPHERDHARQFLQTWRDQGELDADLICGYMQAKGVHARGIKRLRKIIDTMNDN